MYTYQITEVANHVDLSCAESFDARTAVFPFLVDRPGLLRHASNMDISTLIASLGMEDLSMDDLQGVCQQCERKGIWATHDQVRPILQAFVA